MEHSILLHQVRDKDLPNDIVEWAVSVNGGTHYTFRSLIEALAYIYAEFNNKTVAKEWRRVIVASKQQDGSIKTETTQQRL